MGEIQDLVTKKVLKMPVWVWLLVVGAGGGILYYRYRENQNAAAAQNTTADPNTAYGVSPYDQSSDSGSYDPTGAYGGGGYDSGFQEGLQEGQNMGLGSTGLNLGGNNTPDQTTAPNPVNNPGNTVVNIQQGKATTHAKKHPTASKTHQSQKTKTNNMTGGGHRKVNPSNRFQPPISNPNAKKPPVYRAQKDQPSHTTHKPPKRKVKA